MGNGNKYELMAIYKPELKEAEVKQQISNLKKHIEELQGRVVTEDFWGKKKFAYALKKRTEGYYIVLNIELNPEQISAFDTWLNRDSEAIIRGLITKI